MNRSLKNRKGLRATRQRKRQKPTPSSYARDLYYMTESLKNVVEIIIQAAIIGVSLILVGVGLMRAVYILD